MFWLIWSRPTMVSELPSSMLVANELLVMARMMVKVRDKAPKSPNGVYREPNRDQYNQNTPSETETVHPEILWAQITIESQAGDIYTGLKCAHAKVPNKPLSICWLINH
jgi:hypothetical protein